MLNGQTPENFEKSAKDSFTKTPAQMKLLTGFDAPHATYLYIDKSMRDHDLFQAIRRVNRRYGEDKDYGYIIDYKDLFRNIESAVKDYTSGAFDSYDKKDVEGFLKGKYDEAEAEMRGSLYRLTASAVRSFSNCSDRLESHYGYTVNQVDGIRR